MVELHAPEQLQYLSFVGFDSFIFYLDTAAGRQNITALSAAVSPSAMLTLNVTGQSQQILQGAVIDWQ